MNWKVSNKGTVLVLILIFVLLLGTVYATPEYAKKTGQPCIVCHPNNITSQLGPAGQYFKENGTLAGYGEVKLAKGLPGGTCNVCHVNIKPNPIPHSLAGAPYSPNHHFVFNHGGGKFWCLACHDSVNRNKLRLINGTTLPLSDPTPLCAQCHGPVYNDWINHLHGRWAGSWKVGQGKPALQCINCHNPHNPHFKPIKPMPAPLHPPPSPHFANYNLYSAVVLVVSAALAIFAAWK